MSFDCDDLVIGAGISGLGYAYYQSKKGQNIVVLDKANIAGGSVNTVKSDKASNFWLEMGAHTLYNSYGNLIDLIESLNLSDQIIRRKKYPFLIYDQGKLRSIFRYLNLIPFVYGALTLSFRDKKDQSVASFYGRIFGRRNYQVILKDCFNAVLSQDAENFPAEFLFNKKKRHKNYPRSFTLSGGISTLFESIKESKQITFKANQTIQSIKRLDHIWQVNTNESSFRAKRLVIATSAYDAGKLLSSIAPVLAKKLLDINYSEVNSLGLICQKDDLKHIKKMAGIIGRGDAPFYSIVTRDVIFDPTYRGFTCHFKPAYFKVHGQEASLAFLCEFLGIKKTQVVDYFFKKNTVPALAGNHKSYLAEICTLACDHHILLTGNYFYRLALEDCLAQSISLL